VPRTIQSVFIAFAYCYGGLYNRSNILISTARNALWAWSLDEVRRWAGRAQESSRRANWGRLNPKWHRAGRVALAYASVQKVNFRRAGAQACQRACKAHHRRLGRAGAVALLTEEEAGAGREAREGSWVEEFIPTTVRRVWWNLADWDVGCIHTRLVHICAWAHAISIASLGEVWAETAQRSRRRAQSYLIVYAEWKTTCRLTLIYITINKVDKRWTWWYTSQTFRKFD